MRVDQARRLKELETENSRLKKLVGDLSLDHVIKVRILASQPTPPAIIEVFLICLGLKKNIKTDAFSPTKYVAREHLFAELSP